MSATAMKEMLDWPEKLSMPQVRAAFAENSIDLSVLPELTEARDLLAPIYGWFTEGFDTPVLHDAKELLDEVS